ncbi:DEAD/DEAH box helicase [Sporosarcina cyprini]|uniref:DEAD/DEAH box helicase n=1 Tax=Sporosarcina cyprini TaxID=2910523 RepID=UPI001EE0D197|nr:DEAD/DEAH box helicase [Sporosarcina cyprini]MCG3088485.1 DEAD/DEAH box helicase [Sporosarcina cyprini]
MTNMNLLQIQLKMSVQQAGPGRYAISALDDAMPVPADKLASYLFFSNQQALFGLLVASEGNALLLKTSEFLQVFLDTNAHPFAIFSGRTEMDALQIEDFKIAAHLWKNQELWKSIRLNEDSIPEFDEMELGINGQTADILRDAFLEKVMETGIRSDQLPSLLAHLREYGWPEGPAGDLPIQVALRLTEPEEDTDSEWLLETVLVNERGTHWTPAVRKRNAPIVDALPPKWADLHEAIDQRQNEMVSFLRSVDASPDGKFLSQQMSDADVRLFIQEDLPLFQSFGYPVILPAWLKSVTESKMRVRTSAGTASYRSAAGLNEVLSFDWNFSLAGKEMDKDEFRKLVDENREYIRAGDEWFHLDPTWLKRIRELMDRADAGEWTVKDLLFQEVPEEISPLELDEEPVDPLFSFTLQKSLQDYIEIVSSKKGLPAVPISPLLRTELRPYQVEGYNWLVFMREHQFGACLADDMGLGKTVQLITYLLHIHREAKTSEDTPPSLIICPTSVMGNWQKELERFAPELSVHIHYGPSRAREEEFAELIKEKHPDVILTTYGTATQDGETLALSTFSSITLDEAQNIKNMQTKQSRAIRKLTGRHHIALTGTPIENRLSELWAIFDFIHKGYFGSFRRFTEDFIIPIERDDSELMKRKLRSKIRPFLLRRTKNDPDLQLNLPKKLEQNEYCPLTTEQAALYESFIDDTKFKLETLTGFERKGLILKMLSRLKQLCNHPALFLKEPHAPATQMLARSEKLERIVSMAADIAENGEQCLIFTQYIGMGNLIRQCLSELYDIDVPFLTGSMPKGQRDALVDAFQAGEFPIFILSLKAGGTGLNLTKANHVLHADRWWNPAVENQATDRAYRIGQTKFVHVHKFVTVGTIEEKIDKMLEEKAKLSADLIQSSQWLTELSDAELDDLLTFER